MEENNKAPDLSKLCKELINAAYNLIKKNIESSDGLELNVDRVARSMVSVKGRHINDHLRTALGVNDRVIARAWQRVMDEAIELDKEIEADPDNQIVRTDTFDDNGNKVLTVEISDSSPDVPESIIAQSSSDITVKSELPAECIVRSTNGLKFTVKIPMIRLDLNKDYDPGEQHISGTVPKLLGLLVKHSLLEVLQQICCIANKLPITFAREKHNDYDSHLYFTVVPGIEAVVDTETIKHNPCLAEVVAALVTILSIVQDYSASVVGDDCMNLLTSTTPYVVALGRYMYGYSYNYAASYQLGKFIADKMPYVDNHDLIIHDYYIF